MYQFFDTFFSNLVTVITPYPPFWRFWWTSWHFARFVHGNAGFWWTGGCFGFKNKIGNLQLIIRLIEIYEKSLIPSVVRNSGCIFVQQ